MQWSHKFFNRRGYLYLRINMGASNERTTRSTGIEIGSLEIKSYTVARDGNRVIKADRVEGHTLAASKANSYISEVESLFSSAKDAVDAVRLFDEMSDGGSKKVSMDFNEALSEFISYKRRDNVTDGTVEGYELTAAKYARFSGGKSFDVYSKDILAFDRHRRRPVIRDMRVHWESFISFLKEEDGLSPGTVHLQMQRIKTVINWLRSEYGLELPAAPMPDKPDYDAMKVSWPKRLIQRIIRANLFPFPIV